MFGGLTDYFDAASSGRDPTGLGRWVVMTVKVEVQTRIVCGYNPCGNDKPHLGTVYLSASQILDYTKEMLNLPPRQI